MNNMSSDFPCLKISVLEKMSRISGKMDQVTIGPHSVVYAKDAEKLENIENSQNSENTKHTQRSVHVGNNKICMHNGIKFSLNKILSEKEIQRKERVRKQMELRWQTMKEHGRVTQECMALLRSKMALERERKVAEKLGNILAEEERIAEEEEIRRRQERQLYARLAQERREKLEREVEEYNRMKERDELTRQIILLKTEAGKMYREIIMITRSCKDRNCLEPVYAAYAVKLNELLQHIEPINEKIKTGDQESNDLLVMKSVVQKMDAILSSYRIDIEKINVAYDKQGTYNAQTILSGGEEQLEDHRKTLVSFNKIIRLFNSFIIVFVTEEMDISYDEEMTYSAQAVSSEEEEEQLEDHESWEMYKKSQTFLENFLNSSYNEFLKSNNTKKFRFDCQKAINIPVNAISAINGDHLKDKYERLNDLLTGKSALHIKQHVHGEKFCKDVLAKKIVSQGETVICSQPKMAFAIAAVTVVVWNDHLDFGELLLSHFYRTCPFVVPVLIRRREGQSNKDYYKSLGYKYSQDGAVEKQDKYLKRISGLIRLYASFTVSTQRRGVVKSHPYGLENAWSWLAATLNSEPYADVSDICATLILDMLEVAGNSLWTAYPTKFKKLLTALKEDYYPKLVKVSNGVGSGPLVRLEEFLKNALENNSITKPEGILPANFW